MMRWTPSVISDHRNGRPFARRRQALQLAEPRIEFIDAVRQVRLGYMLLHLPLHHPWERSQSCSFSTSRRCGYTSGSALKGGDADVRKHRVKKSSVKEVAVYCKCRMPCDHMIECTKCKKWFHIDTCVRAPPATHIDNSLAWFCFRCLWTFHTSLLSLYMRMTTIVVIYQKWLLNGIAKLNSCSLTRLILRNVPNWFHSGAF